MKRMYLATAVLASAIAVGPSAGTEALMQTGAGEQRRRPAPRDDPSLQVGKEEAATMLATIGFKPVDDVALFPDKYFVTYGS